jgi:hypothetical protein
MGREFAPRVLGSSIGKHRTSVVIHSTIALYIIMSENKLTNECMLLNAQSLKLPSRLQCPTQPNLGLLNRSLYEVSHAQRRGQKEHFVKQFEKESCRNLSRYCHEVGGKNEVFLWF